MRELRGVRSRASEVDPTVTPSHPFPIAPGWAPTNSLEAHSCGKPEFEMKRMRCALVVVQPRAGSS